MSKPIHHHNTKGTITVYMFHIYLNKVFPNLTYLTIRVSSLDPHKILPDFLIEGTQSHLNNFIESNFLGKKLDNTSFS